MGKCILAGHGGDGLRMASGSFTTGASYGAVSAVFVGFEPKFLFVGTELAVCADKPGGMLLPECSGASLPTSATGGSSLVSIQKTSTGFNSTLQNSSFVNYTLKWWAMG